MKYKRKRTHRHDIEPSNFCVTREFEISRCGFEWRCSFFNISTSEWGYVEERHRNLCCVSQLDGGGMQWLIIISRNHPNPTITQKSSRLPGMSHEVDTPHIRTAIKTLLEFYFDRTLTEKPPTPGKTTTMPKSSHSARSCPSTSKSPWSDRGKPKLQIFTVSRLFESVSISKVHGILLRKVILSPTYIFQYGLNSSGCEIPPVPLHEEEL